MYDMEGRDVASTIYYGLFSLQHRGQESCGIAVSRTDGPQRNSSSVKGMDLSMRYSNAENLDKMKGDIGVGHVRLFDSRSKCCREYTAAGSELYQGNPFTGT